MCFLSHSFVALAVCFGSLSCWSTHLWHTFNTLAGFNALALMVHVHRPFEVGQWSCPLSRKKPTKHNVSTYVFDSGDSVLGFIGSTPPRLNTAIWVDAKKLDFGLIWPQHFHPVLLWIIAKLQTGPHMCFLEPGDLVVLQDFLVTMVPVALRSLTRSSRAVLGWFLTVLMIIETRLGEGIAWSPSTREIDITPITPTVVTFSPSCLAMVL